MMNSRWLWVGWVFVCPLCVDVLAESSDEPSDAKVVEIPLGEIWAHKMPGTRAIDEMEPLPNASRLEGSTGEGWRQYEPRALFALISEALAEKSENRGRDQSAGLGFAVEGRGLKALQGAYSVLVKGEKPVQCFSSESDISVVFFSYLFGNYVHLQHVERHGDVVDIQYRFVPHISQNLSVHLAVVPLGKLPDGTYDVEITRLPLEKKYVDLGFKPLEKKWDSKIVCRSFSFGVGKEGDGSND